MIEQRTKNALDLIVEKEGIHKDELMVKLGLSSHQVDYVIDKISDILKINKQSKLKIVNNYLFLEADAKQFILDYLQQEDLYKSYDFSAEERERYILLMLYYYKDEFLSVNHFLDSLLIGKTTFMADLKRLETTLLEYQLKIKYSRKKGYELQGDESYLRYFMMRMIMDDLNTKKDFVYSYFLNNERIPYQEILLKKIHYYRIQFHLSLPENRMTELYYIMILSLPRVSTIVDEEIWQISSWLLETTREYRFAQSVLKELDIQDAPTCQFFASLILGMVVSDYQSDNDDDRMILFLVKKFIQRFDYLSGTHLSGNEAFIMQVFAHFKSAFYRIIFKIPIVNTLHEKIILEYGDIYHIVNESMKSVGNILGMPIPDDEISLMSLYFANIYYEQLHRTKLSKSAVVVCSSGIGSSTMIMTELKKLFPQIHFIGPMSTKQLLSFTNDYDMIFTTVPDIRYVSLQKPIYRVNPVMSAQERYLLIKEVEGIQKYALDDLEIIMNVVKKYTTIHDEEMLQQKLIQVLYEGDIRSLEGNEIKKGLRLLDIFSVEQLDFGTVESWQDGVRKSGKLLLEQGYIVEAYIQKIIETLEEHGPYMVVAEKVALLHAKPVDGVNQVGISLFISNEPVDLLGKSVQFFFTLSAIDAVQHIPAISDFLSICGNTKFLEELKIAPTHSNKVALIEKFLNE